MTRVTATEFVKNFGVFQDKALVEPVFVRKHDRDSVVVISATEYARLKTRDRQALTVEQFDEARLVGISETEMDPAHAHLNALLDDA